VIVKKTKEKLKRNSRNKKGRLKGHKTFYDKKRGICFIDKEGKNE
jgi:hypothetical protein